MIPNYPDLYNPNENRSLIWTSHEWTSTHQQKKKETKSGPSQCDFTFHLWVRRDHFIPDLNAYGDLTVYVLPIII